MAFLMANIDICIVAKGGEEPAGKVSGLVIRRQRQRRQTKRRKPVPAAARRMYDGKMARSGHRLGSITAERTSCRDDDVGPSACVPAARRGHVQSDVQSPAGGRPWRLQTAALLLFHFDLHGLERLGKKDARGRGL